MKLASITRKQAEARGYRPLTNAYGPSEKAMLENTIRDFYGCNVVLVEAVGGVEIWRAAGELKTITGDDD